MVGLYSRIFLEASRQRKIIMANIASCFSKNDRETNISSVNKDAKTAKTLMLVLGVFMVSWTPFFIVIAIESFGGEGEVLDRLYVVGVLLGVLNSSVNPFIYGWKNMEFRRAYLKFLRKLCFKRILPTPVEPVTDYRNSSSIYTVHK